MSIFLLPALYYELSKLRDQGLVERIPRSRRYRLVGKGYSICVAFLKLFEKIHAPLTAGLPAPFGGDRTLAEEKRCALDRLYQHVSDDLDALFRAIGLKSPCEGRKREQNPPCGPPGASSRRILAGRPSRVRIQFPHHRAIGKITAVVSPCSSEMY